MGIFDRFKKNRDTGTPSREAVIRQTFQRLDESLRKASIAKIGGFRPSGNPLTTKFSGDVVMAPDENWPVFEGKALQSFLQVNISELPYVPHELRDVELMTVFVMEEEIPFDRPHGEGWAIRTYKDVEKLQPRKNPIVGSGIKPAEIRWSLVDNEAPHWEDAWSVADLSDFNQLEDSTDLFYDNYSNHAFTKVGGWPSLVQGELSMGTNDFVFQIGSEEKANWSWLDAGTVYFGIKNGQWTFECQFY